MFKPFNSNRIISSGVWAFILFFLCSSVGFAQHNFYGRVVDAETKEPIPYATIFLTNTTFGVAADMEGGFQLDIPTGRHEVIARLLGYEPLTFFVHTEDLAKQGYRVELIPMDQDLELVEVQEERDPVWYRNLDRFKQHFIGLSENAKNTIITNEEVLLMDSESNPGELQVRARDVLLIENQNLGYQIEYLLSKFSLNSKQGKILYGGNPLFINDSSSSKAKQKRWEKNREEAYYGSIQHLFQSLYHGMALEQGYEFRKIRQVPNPDRPTDAEIDQAKEFLKVEADKDKRDSLITFFLMKEKLPREVRLLVNQPFLPEEFVRKDPAGKVFLELEDFLQVTYTKERESNSYVGEAFTEQRGAQSSVIEQLSGALELYPNGSYSDTFGLMFEGYMAWEKVADLMPLDYLPAASKWGKK